MPTGDPGLDERLPALTGAPGGPSRSADSERIVTRVLRSIGDWYTIQQLSGLADNAPGAPATVDPLGTPIAPGPAKLGHPDGDLDSLSDEASEDALSELVLDGELVGERLDLADEREVEGEVAEARDEPRRRRRLLEEPRYVAHGALGLLNEKALDQIRIGAVVDADTNQQRHPRLRHVVVRDDRLGHPLVRDGHHDVLEHPHAGRAPPDVHNVALGRVGDLHVVTYADRLVGQQVDARKEVRQRVLQRQGHREAADAQRREDRRDLDTERREQHQEPDSVQEAASDGLSEPCDRAITRVMVVRA